MKYTLKTTYVKENKTFPKQALAIMCPVSVAFRIFFYRTWGWEALSVGCGRWGMNTEGC